VIREAFQQQATGRRSLPASMQRPHTKLNRNPAERVSGKASLRARLEFLRAWMVCRLGSGVAERAMRNGNEMAALRRELRQTRRFRAIWQMQEKEGTCSRWRGKTMRREDRRGSRPCGFARKPGKKLQCVSNVESQNNLTVMLDTSAVIAVPIRLGNGAFPEKRRQAAALQKHKLKPLPPAG
jgi:hypothetical protein